MNILKMKHKKFPSTLSLVYFIFLFFNLSSSCFARSLFELDVSIPNERAVKGFSDVEDIVDQLDNGGLDNLLEGYVDDVTETTANINIRGLPTIVTYDLNSSTLNFIVPSLGINETFEGATRDESQDLFFDWLKGKGNNLLTKVLQEIVATTPADPVAGNPNSLMSTMANADFSVASNSISFDGEGDSKELPNLLSFGGGYTYSSSGGFNTQVVSLPINYIIPLNEAGLSAIIDVPLTYLNIDGGHAVHGSFGLGMRLPVVRKKGVNWSLTPFARAGISGSKNLGSAAIIYSGSLTSTVNLTFDSWDLRVSINNMGGYYRTDSLEVGDFSIDYDLENGVFKNGIAIEGALDWTLFDDPTSWELSFVDTQFIGSDLYLNRYDEVDLSFGTRRVTNQMSWQSLRLGIGYTFGDDYDAYRVSMNYRF